MNIELSKRFELKLGRAQLRQWQEMEVLTRGFQLTGSVNFETCFMDQSVACVALDGVLWILWQGVASMSPDSSRSLGIQAGWEAEWFRFRAELFLILFENEGSGLGGSERGRPVGGKRCSAVLPSMSMMVVGDMRIDLV